MEIQRLLLLLLIFLFFPTPNSAQGPVTKLDNTTDQESLLAFKSYITHDPYNVLTSWNSSSPFCSWQGIACNVTKQRVTDLNLSDLALRGSIAPHLGNLSFLGSLNLQNNSLSGSLPSEIGRLFRLKKLNLSSNRLQGIIPGSLGLCSRLVFLDLSSNNLEGRIPGEIGRLKELHALMFADNFLTGPIPSSFGNLSSITNIIILRNSLKGTIPEGIGNLPLLVNLQLGLNEIDGEIPLSIFNRSTLIQVVLVGNRLSGTLPSDMFTRLPNLNTLFIGGNKFSGPLPVSLGNASNLVRADFSANNFSGPIPSLWNLVKIQILNLEINQFVNHGDRGWDFLDSLSNATQLRGFSLATNLLTGKLPPTIGSLSRHLSLLVMGENFLEGSLPAEISNLEGLTMLTFEHNHFSGTVPASLGILPILQILHLEDNNFSGKIPSSLGSLGILAELTLNRNFLAGPVPSSLRNLQHLQVLDLSENMLNGTIPPELFKIPSFSKVLNLSFNLLTGHIPQEIGMLQMIYGIDVANNRLSGEIPATIGGCSSLWYLNVSGNSFQGPVPSSLASIKGLTLADLSSNNLSGEIPASLESLNYLEVLDLSMNRLQGSVPTKGVFANLTAVFLSGNPKLCGGLPQLGLPQRSLNLPPRRKKHARRLMIVGLAAGIFAALILVGLASILLLSRRKNRTKRPMVNDAAAAAAALCDIGRHKAYTYYDIKSATNDFSTENIVGEGSFGSVYRGTFRDGTVAAIKVFKLEQHGASKSFISECEALRNVRHNNLVRIISVCCRGDFKALVLPYTSNGSLEGWLRGEEERGGGGMEMRQRLRIAGDVASAVEYLHHDCETPIVHCDLKPSNVLLDEDMRARVGDFGIARMLINPINRRPYSSSGGGSGNSSTLGLKGSIGYIAPEYGYGDRVSTKGDVYSFGILLLELFTGKKPTAEEFTDSLDLRRWVSEGLAGSGVAEILDPKLTTSTAWKSEYQGDAVSILELGLRCARNSPEERPTMREVCLFLKNRVRVYQIS